MTATGFSSMYRILYAVLLMLPTFGSTFPAQPISPLGVPTGPRMSTATAVAPLDPRFSIQPLYRSTPIDEDQSLVAAVQVMGFLGAQSFAARLKPAIYYDDRIPNVVIGTRTPNLGGVMEARFLVWGIYLGVKDMIESMLFLSVRFVLRWDGQTVGTIFIQDGADQQLLPARNSTDDLQQRSSPNGLTLFASDTSNGTSLDLSFPSTPSDLNRQLSLEIMSLGDTVPKYSVIMTLLEGILSVASSPTRSLVRDPVQVALPAPYDARLQVLPEQMSYGQPYLTFGLLALALRQIPAVLLLQARQWAEVNFNIVMEGRLVAKGSLLKGER